MLAGVPVSADSTVELAAIVRAAGADKLADRNERPRQRGKLLALTIDERAIILEQLDDPPDGLVDPCGVLMNEHQWRRREGLDP
jgi:hypothetical protein